MSRNGNHLYLFGDFSFDAEGKVLRRGEKPLSLTPKTLMLLEVLISNHGQIVEKEKLMAEVWADSFVEDSNLTFTVRQLRKALADDAHAPTYIETVPRRGYRFIAEVREIADTRVKILLPETDLPLEAKKSAGRKYEKFYIPAIAVAALLVGAIALGGWYARNRKTAIDAPILSSAFSSEKLSTDGNVQHAVVSADGKTVIYLTGSGGKRSVWLRQLESSNNVQIIPPSDDVYLGLALSPDGNFLYFTRKPKYAVGQADVYRVSIFGGVPQKIVNETQGWISLAPGGERISFVRCYYREDENCSLWIADSSDGKNEKKIASRPHPLRIGDNEISPDGRTVAFAAGQSRNGANEFGLVEVDIETGAERDLTAQKFFNIKNLEWLPNQSDLLITASRVPNKNFRIWQVSAVSGDASALTKDSEAYAALSLSRDAKILVSTQIKEDFHLYLLNTENSLIAPRVLANATTVAFAPNGKIVFSSSMTGNSEIWSINPDGSEQRQMTNDAADDLTAAVSPDSNSIFFASNRTGAMHVWRMNVDGSNQTQVTTGEGGFPVYVSPDEKWLYYTSALQKTLRRVSIKGGVEELVLNKTNYPFAVSPDGLYIAFAEKQGEEITLKIVSLDDKQTLKTFKVSDGKATLNQLVWSKDGRILAYILADSEFENNTVWLQSLDGEQSLRQIADLGDEEISEMSGFALAPDGKTFAVAKGGWKHDAVLLKGLK